MRKKLLCLLLISTLLSSSLVACDTAQNDIGTTTENTVETTAPQDKRRQSNDSNVPPDDISSYNDIIDLYRYIVNFYPYYTEEKMIAGECDGIDAIADEDTKELYKKLFISGYRFYLEEYANKYQEDGRNYFGYAITDVNQNGSDELILLTDLYDIVAVFGMKKNAPKLLLDNYDKKYFCYMDEQGRFYTQRFEASEDLYTQIYSLNECDDLELVEEYLCVKANYLDHDECYDITNGEMIRIPKSEWTELIHGWVYGCDVGIITKTNTEFKFIRLFGELNLYLPNIISWTWSSSQFYTNENALIISKISDNTVSFSLYDTFYPIYHRKVSVEAALNGNIVEFETQEISGKLEFGLDSIWLIIDESNIAGVPSGVFIYTEVGFSKG